MKLTDKDKIELQIQAGILTDESLMAILGRSLTTIAKLSPIKKRFPDSTVGIYLIEDVKNFLRSDLEISRGVKRKKGELLDSLIK